MSPCGYMIRYCMDFFRVHDNVNRPSQLNTLSGAAKLNLGIIN